MADKSKKPVTPAYRYSSSQEQMKRRIAEKESRRKGVFNRLINPFGSAYYRSKKSGKNRNGD